VTNQGLNWIVAGDINGNLLSRFERSDLFLDALPRGYQLVNKDKHFTYIHNRDCARSVGFQAMLGHL